MYIGIYKCFVSLSSGVENSRREKGQVKEGENPAPSYTREVEEGKQKNLPPAEY